KIPRRDAEYHRDKYFRSMLIIFKPWRTVVELCDDLLESKFNALRTEADLYHQKVIENMQVLHECRDSRD
ncbi:hypothetical protein BDN72DRAFT_748906, partial [Pluteus cervinus]